jgi:hypothetical protein
MSNIAATFLLPHFLKISDLDKFDDAKHATMVALLRSRGMFGNVHVNR